MLDHLNAQHEIELAIGEREALEVRPHELRMNAGVRRRPGCRLEHASGDVCADDTRRHRTKAR